MIDALRTLEVKLKPNEPVSVAERDFLILLEHYRMLLNSKSPFIQKEIVDIEIILKKCDSQDGKSKIATSGER